MQQGAYIIETKETESECRSVESKGHRSIISVFSQMGQHILPFFSSVVDSYLFLVSFLFLLFASRPSILPVLMWQAWEMNNFMSGEGGPLLSLSFRLQTWTEKGKKKYCQSVQWHRLPVLTNGQWNLVNTSHPDRRHLSFMCLRYLHTTVCITSKHNCCFILSLCSKTGPTVVQMFSPCDIVFILGWAWSINDQISTDSTMGQEKRRMVWWAAEVCSSASEQALPEFPSCDVERVSAAQTLCLHSKAQLNANQRGTGR